MASITVRSNQATYEVTSGFIQDLQEFTKTSTPIIIDEYFDPASILGRSAGIFVKATEDQKTLMTVERVLVEMKKLGTTRDDKLVAVGGGIIQDVATLAASLYMRGVSWTYYPTTLLAMVDSCIGGKSSINAGGVKNLVGNIYPPSSVIIDVRFIDTLNNRDRVSGIFEALKIAFCAGQNNFETMCKGIDAISVSGYEEVIFQSLNAKKWFIEKDEFDLAERRLLNFGHTFGHGIEVASMYSIPHGVSVGIGMLCAIEYVRSGRKLTGSETELRHRSEQLVKMAYNDGRRVPEVDLDLFLQTFRSDKKHSNNAYRVVLPSTNGGVEIAQLERNSSTEKQMLEAVTSALELLSA